MSPAQKPPSTALICPHQPLNLDLRGEAEDLRLSWCFTLWGPKHALLWKRSDVDRIMRVPCPLPRWGWSTCSIWSWEQGLWRCPEPSPRRVGWSAWRWSPFWDSWGEPWSFTFRLLLTSWWQTETFIIRPFVFSYMTTTFVIEAMAAANAQLRWKRREQEEVRAWLCM